MNGKVSTLTKAKSAALLPTTVHCEDAAVAAAFLDAPVPIALQGIIRPINEAQVAQIMEWANQTGTALLPVSSSAGLRRFGADRVVGPVTILDLSAMNRVLHADGRDAIALIEPGLTFPEFDAVLAKHNLRSFKPFLPRRTKSVLASFLEREAMITPGEHWDTSDPLAALGFMFGNGEQFRTGGASVPVEIEKQLKTGLRQMMASGPIGTDYTRVLQGAQGTLGVVCWASIYCERIPALEESHLFGSDQIEPLLAMVREIALRQLGLHYFILSREQLAAAIAEDSADYARLISGHLHAWNLYVSIGAPDFAPEQAMAWKRKDLGAIARQAGVDLDILADGELVSRLAARLHAPPETYFKTVPRGRSRDVFCLTQMSNAAALVAKTQAVLQGADLAGSGIAAGVYLQPTIQGVSCHLEISLFHDENASEAASYIEDKLVAAMANNGGFFSRPHGSWADDAFTRNPALVQQLRQVKRMFDPAGVLSPGRLCFAAGEV